MNALRKLTERESVTADLIKALAIFSVITAHTMTLCDFGVYAKLVSSLWSAFARVGVVFFFVIGGYFYNRREHDTKAFWKKKLFRIILPWLICATLTYGVGVATGTALRVPEYLKWILGSGTWYYYIVVYLFFMLVFGWVYKYNWVLYLLAAAHIVILCLKTCGLSFTPSVDWATDYLNPLYWMGYFSLGILIRRKSWDLKLQTSIWIPIVSGVIMIAALVGIMYFEIYTYFHIVSYVFALSLMVCVAKLFYGLARFKVLLQLRNIGTSSYCIYLLHMQIVQKAVSLIPEGNLKVTVAPIAGLLIMVVFVFVCSFALNRLPFGKKLKMVIGL